ncbi:hypothetical protein [Amycolatopsis thermophila]|uniref:Uncharacterized protein n=1 Tax=Amycolatopsis thermophila TaxID=206084 RepID=A0ABU0EM04_9PSEU|nr:hypothetical protein [Amycolatopsis thermophila]MDQ0376262.1 hypothetical protein [Amycolatopsis thermophila]
MHQRLHDAHGGEARQVAVVDDADSGYLVRGVLHGVVCAAVLLAAVAVASSLRLRQRPHLKFVGR